MADMAYNAGMDIVNPREDIFLSDHAVSQSIIRRISIEDIMLTLDLGQHSEGMEEGTMEACSEIDGKPITVIYDELDHRFRDVFYIITVIKKRCPE